MTFRTGRKRGTPIRVDPSASIVIAIDTAFVVANAGQVESGIYMFDNQVTNGSTGEATMELCSVVPTGSKIGWNSLAIDPSRGDTVIITGFNVSQGSIFGSAGFPAVQPALPDQPAGSYWIGQATQAGSQTYQIQLLVAAAGFKGGQYFVNFSASVSAW
ncbi:MAG TPA: hypothetical protein VGC56_17275 [Allosphingosinicella sp.]|jgi:hypothetical protein